jgi:Domain of unknown function (DUF4170)
MAKTKAPPQGLHLVFGGELSELDGFKFKDVSALDIVGIYPDYEAAEKAWLKKARDTIDNAQMRYVVVPLHKLLDPASKKKK